MPGSKGNVAYALHRKDSIALCGGVIVEVTEGDALSAGSNPMTKTVKLASRRFIAQLPKATAASRGSGRPA
jgi:hypothetical protein